MFKNEYVVEKKKQRAVLNFGDYFTKINVSGVEKKKYNYCGPVLSCGLGTSNLNKLARQIHNIERGFSE